MNAREKRQRELEGMTCLQLVEAFEGAFKEGSVLGFPLKSYAINSILAKEFDISKPDTPLPIRPIRELAAVK